jgi:MtfA peptidase
MIGIIIVSAGLAACLAWGIWRVLARRAKRRRLTAAPFPDEWQEICRRNVGLYNRLPEDLRRQLHGLVNVFLGEKRFYGCKGLEITDEIRVTVAAQACMLILNRPTGCFRKLKSIYVYPETYLAKETIRDGVIEIEGHSVRLGESWRRGPVVLAWDSIQGGARNVQDGLNVVLHEFSHQLDQEDGWADGAPILEGRSGYATWSRVLNEEYQALRSKAQRGGYSDINTYGATDPAEFFAVVTETFFEKPRQMQRKHPDLYEQLSKYYKIDPASWVEE